MPCECGSFVSIDICTALHEIELIACEQGTTVVFIHRKEQDVGRDSLGTVKKRSLDTRYKFKAFPVERQPNRKQLERAGIREDVDTVITIPMSMMIESGLIRTPQDSEYTTIGEDFAHIDIIRSTVVLDGEEWKIRDKGLSGRLGGIPLYVTFGLERN
jgi:hypothetical protein